MEKRYLLKKNKDTLGPFTLDKLKEKQLKPSDLVWYEGLPEWTPLGNLAEFNTPATSLKVEQSNSKNPILQFIKNLFIPAK